MNERQNIMSEGDKNMNKETFKISVEDLLKIRDLKINIAKYDKQYYEYGVSDISDAEYDRLYDEYLLFEKKYPEIANMQDAPTKRVGAGKEAGTSTGLPKFNHKSPLLSIDRKAKDISELRDFFEKCGGEGTEFIVEPKLDGITCNINYENGQFINAATRGNGYIGDLITDNFVMTDTIYPNSIPMDFLEIRGEAIIPYDFFKDNLVNEYSNPRNAVAGIMRQIEVNEVKGKGVQVMFYDIGQTSMALDDSDMINLKKIKDLGFQSVPVCVATCWEELKKIVESGLNGYIQQIDGFNVLMDKENIYPQAVCDGLVIKVASQKKRDEIGFSSKGPKWAFAYKFKPLQTKTRIDHVEWQVGKSGRLTPVAVFDEINLGGTKITRATLNNYDYMQNLQIEKKKQKGLQMNDLIIVERSNDVIPRVVAIEKRQNCIYSTSMDTTEIITKRMKTFKEPMICPVCGQPVTSRYPLHYCTNPACSSQRKGRLEHYVSRDAMNIVGLGEGIIDVLYEEGILTDIPSIYSLESHKDALLKLPKFGERKVSKLLSSIEASKTPELWQFIYALSIDGVGHKASKDLAQRYHTLDNLLKATEEELLEMEDMGNITATNIITYLQNEDMLAMIQSLLDTGIQVKEVSVAGDTFKGKTFVITGTLEHPRKYYQDIIESNGGKVSGSVSKKTTAVLIGADAGSKEAKARKLVAEGNPVEILDTEEKIKNYLG